MENKEGFLLYKGMYESIEDLTLNERGLLFTAIYEYQIHGEAPEIKNRVVRVAFKFFLNQFRIDEENIGETEETCE